MAEFCEDCPLRGDCDSYLESVDTLSVRGGIRITPVSISQCVDSDGYGSELFRTVDADVLSEIDTCQSPVLKEEPHTFRKSRTIKVCGALGIKPNVTERLETAFDRALDELDGIREIDNFLAKLESRAEERMLIVSTIVALGSSGITAVGGIDQNIPIFYSGLAGTAVGLGGFGYVYRGIWKQRNRQREN